ncbi:histidine kinase [Paenibacillus sp. HWE-109]|uniref:sensor histidine kinase n=1 Tax=Paenibacillus sp. HWE-109 TaxID=1306526 RepID=UPI001EDEFD4C|nr:histidine kinase [Paenibacillus sp. HWE-109]UKS29303.1 histidine kinase [Paenibacillus sp. HWE-109]
MILAFCLFIIGPFLLVGWYSASRTSATMKNEVGKTMLQLVKQNHATMENTMSSARDKTVTFLDNHFFSNPKQFAFWTHISSISELSEADTILERWSSDGTEYTLYLENKGEQPFPLNALYKNQGLIYLDQGSPYPEWAEQTQKEKGAGSIRLATMSNGQSTVSFTRSILHPGKYDESIGFLVVSKLEVLLTKNMVSVQLPPNAGVYLFDDRDELLMQAGTGTMDLTELPENMRNQTSGFYFANSRNHQDLYAISNDINFNTRLIYKIPLASIMGNQTDFQRMIMVMLAVYLLLVLLFVLYLLRNIIKPLAKLVMFTRLYEPGRPFDFGNLSSRASTDEFGVLYKAFIRMTGRLNDSIEENYGMKIKQKEQELTTLHSQITPHLLYNTLDSIYWYALESGNEGVGSMVKDLSKLLRIGLSKGKSIISTSEELEHIQAYIRLQMKRYPGNFEVFWEIEEGIGAYTMPKVLIQPLVENAIFHGIQSMDGEGHLWVRMRRSAEDVHILVEDNGFIPVNLDKLQSIVHGHLQDKGYGIRNVHQRIQLHYGEGYGLSYRLREGGGLIAHIVIPAQPSE